jgi:rhomboid protease GluP
VSDQPSREESSGLRDVLFPKRGLSATEVLILLNLAVAGALLLLWGRDYTLELRGWSGEAWQAVRSRHAYEWWLASIFIHANPGHLIRNMVALLAGAGAVEFLMGGGWTFVVYLLTGLAGAWSSFAGHGQPPLSVGASGAIFGLLGSTLTFIIRRRTIFQYAQRWKVWRVYVPLFVLLFLPALANADAHAHLGGFALGVLLGGFIPPHPRVPRLAAVDPLADDEEEGPGGQGPES